MMKFAKKINIYNICRLFFSVLLLFFFALPVFAANKKNSDGGPHLFGFQMGLGSSCCFYGDQSIVQLRDEYFPVGDSSRFLLNGVFEGVFFMHEYVSLDLGALLWFDSIWRGNNKMFILEYDFFMGFRVYPKLKGFHFGIDYLVGSYTNFLEFV